MNRLTAIVAALMLAGCSLAPEPAPESLVGEALPSATRIPADWAAGAPAGTVVNNWLAALQDPQLVPIVAEAIANNPDLQVAEQRVSIAQQTVQVVGAQLLPQVNAQLGRRGIHDRDAGETTYSSIGFASAAWEIDLWGRLRAQRAAAVAGYQASALDYAQARQSLAATVARVWYQAIEARQLVVLSQASVAIYQEQLRLVTVREKAGKVSDLDRVYASANLDTAQSSAEIAQQAYAKTRRALELLLGRYPSAQISVAEMFPPLPLPPTAAVPSSLLQRRPDIVAARQRVIAAFRQAEAARLALLPDFEVSLAYGRLDNQLIDLARLNPWLGTAAIGSSIPIYEGGALLAKIEIANAQQAEAVASYGSVILRSFGEVEDALAGEQYLQQSLPYEQQALADRTAAVKIATVQYLAGQRDLLWVSKLQGEAIVAQAQLIQLTAQLRVNRVQLLLALGGGFDSQPAIPPGT